MEIGKNIQSLRKEKSFSQEELAEKLKVARQTISKWELGETSPDLRQAKELSKIFNVSLDELVSNDINNILMSKVSNTERLAGMIIKILKFGEMFMVISFVVLILVFVSLKYFEVKPDNLVADSYGVYCNIDNEKKYYEATVSRDNPEVIELNDEAREIASIMKIDVSKYRSIEQLIKDIKKYVVSHNGKC